MMDSLGYLKFIREILWLSNGSQEIEEYLQQYAKIMTVVVSERHYIIFGT